MLSLYPNLREIQLERDTFYSEVVNLGHFIVESN